MTGNIPNYHQHLLSHGIDARYLPPPFFCSPIMSQRPPYAPHPGADKSPVPSFVSPPASILPPSDGRTGMSFTVEGPNVWEDPTGTSLSVPGGPTGSAIPLAAVQDHSAQNVAVQDLEQRMTLLRDFFGRVYQEVGDMESAAAPHSNVPPTASSVDSLADNDPEMPINPVPTAARRASFRSQGQDHAPARVGHAARDVSHGSKHGPALSLDTLLKQKLVLSDLVREVPYVKVALAPLLSPKTRVTTVRNVLQATNGWIRRACQKSGADSPGPRKDRDGRHEDKISQSEIVANLKEDLDQSRRINERMRSQSVQLDSELRLYQKKTEELESARLRLVEHNAFLTQELMNVLRDIQRAESGAVNCRLTRQTSTNGPCLHCQRNRTTSPK